MKPLNVVRLYLLLWLILPGIALALEATPVLGTSPADTASLVHAKGGTSIAPKRLSVDPDVLPVFGQNLFFGNFSKDSFSGFDPDYSVSVGDKIEVKLWGAYNYTKVLTVDAQGNLFLPKVGPIKVLGVRNSELGDVVRSRIKGVYRSNVQSYINLTTAQPVKVFVAGFVVDPGMYRGLSSDSILHYLDLAGGVDPDRGSYIDIAISRNGVVREHIDLYQFILEGKRLGAQFVDGDTIVVAARRNVIGVDGLVQNRNRFEFSGNVIRLEQALKLAQVLPEATHVRVVRNTGAYRNVEYLSLRSIKGVLLYNGDKVTVTADKKPGTITVRVEGEHLSSQEYVLPYGTRLGQLMEKIEFSENSDSKAISLYRKSVKERQKRMLEQNLKRLESTALTARSATSGEVKIRTAEADLILKWVQRAKAIQPKGQVILGDMSQARKTILEDGDVVKVPSVSNLVMISGEVLFPTATIYKPGALLNSYIEDAGGYVQNEKSSRVVVLHQNGAFTVAKKHGWGRHLTAKVQPGDEVLVLPRIDLKKLQITKDFTQVLYQIAVAAGVVLAL